MLKRQNFSLAAALGEPMPKQALSSDFRKNAARADSDLAVFVGHVLTEINAGLRTWRDRLRTQKPSDELVTRGEISSESPLAWWRPRRMIYRALAELNDADARNLSDSGRRLRREALQHLGRPGRVKTGEHG